MPGTRHVETIGKALRRQAQLKRWSKQRQTKVDTPPQPPQPYHEQSSTPSAAEAARTSALHRRLPQLPTRTRAPASRSEEAAPFPPSSTLSPASTLLQASRTLQEAYRQRDVAPAPSSLQRRLAELLQSSTSKAEAEEAFSLVANSSDQEALSPTTFAHFTCALLKHNVAAQMGVQAYEAALADAVGATQGPWGGIEPEEARAFALYQAQRLERYAVKGTSFNEKLGLTLEGADNSLVALTEWQLRKHASRALPAPCDVLGELMHLDVSWSVALRLHRYARELTTLDPPADMTTRLMSLMTGYRTNGLGSRPWAAALQLYDGLLRSGYDAPLDAHTAALDAIWRRGDVFVKPHHTVPQETRDDMWASLVRVREKVRDEQVTGEAGCRFTEALVKAAAAAGRWEAAVQVLSDLDITVGTTSHRLLVPTAETFLFAMAACNTARNAAHATSLLQTFHGLYRLRSAHPEALHAYLQSLRHVDHLSGQIGALVEDLVLDGRGLDRPCSVTCLQLLSSPRVHTKTEKWRLAEQLLRFYDSNPWPQQPQVRQAELQTVFRCCHLIAAAACAEQPAGVAASCPLMEDLRHRLGTLFGRDSPECRWLEDTEVYSLLTTTSWSHALTVFQRQVAQRPSSRIAELPIPLRQARRMFAQALLRHGRSSHARGGAEHFALEEEDSLELQRTTMHGFLAFAVAAVRDVYAGTDDTVPHGIVGELLLLQALHASQPGVRQRLALEALRELSRGEASAVTPHTVDLVSQALSLTQEHVESILVEGSAQLRWKALQREEGRRIRAHAPLEQVLV